MCRILKCYVHVKDTYPGMEMRKIECVGHYQKCVGALLQKLMNKEKRLGGRGRLAHARVDQLKNYADVAICQKVGDLQNMRSSF